MQVDYVLILAAGRGTRMGEAGRSLPKVIWPVFEKTLLELEVEYAKIFKPQKIFINLYHEKDYLEKTIHKVITDNIVELVKENEPLDIGGAIHNIASKVNYKGRLLIINCDQFIMLNSEVVKEFSNKSDESAVCLLSYNVDRKDGYNALDIKNGKLEGIIPNSEAQNSTFDTYTGVSCVNLAKLERISGKSNFFDSIANHKKNDVSVLNIKTSRYWDFGTINRYYKSMFAILDVLNSKTREPFVDFLKSCEAFNLDKIGQGGYGALEGIIDLKENSVHVENTIYLSQSRIKASESHSIVGSESEDLVILD
jgi:mannose-1-phosphate guanylyltransferase